MSTQPRPRPSAMDPPHITEFASERYFEKLSQSHARQQAGAQASTSTAGQTQTQTQQHTLHLQPSSSTAPTTDHLDHGIPASSSFILPLRESKAATEPVTKLAEPKKDKSRFFGLRHKVSLLHSKPTPAPLVEPQVTAPEARVSIESTASSIPLDQLFLALPNELQLQIISSLPLTDVLNLRRTSKSWHALITLNEGSIVRYHLDQHIPAYARRLYPVDDKSRVDFHYLCSLWHRLHVASKLAFLMCEWITKDIFLRQTESQRLAFAHQHECMRRRLIPLLFTIFHFFETYRKLHLDYIRENDGVGLQQRPFTVNPIERQIMNMYDDRTLLRVHEVFPLVISSFCRQLRPPTYVGRVERSLRGYLREKPSDEIHTAILCLGGMRQVERLWEIKGYNSRRAAVDSWFNGLTKDAMEPLSPQQSAASAGGEPQRQPSTKSRFKFGRKKSSSGAERPTHRGSFSEAISARVRSPFGSIDSTNGGYFDHNFVFHTSLAADAPMAPLEVDAAATLLKDLPVLQHIWLTTAEALVLERGIVQSPRDIKRNHHVMHHLIREDGICEEDEWWYGRGIPESVRPVVTAGECDDLA